MPERQPLTDLQAAYLRAVRDGNRRRIAFSPMTVWKLEWRGFLRRSYLGTEVTHTITPAGLEALRAWEAGR